MAGESSGERYAADLIAALRRLMPTVAPFGVGGAAMTAAGAELLCDVRDTAVVGLSEVVSRIAFFRDLKTRLLAETARRRPRAAVLVDFSGFNLRLARALAAAGIAVVWYVSPQVWAWRRYRARALGKLAREILVVFPFEVEFYRKLGIEATFVGHPLVDEVRPSCGRDDLSRELSLEPSERLVALLPGSRLSEVTRLSGILADAARLMAREMPCRFVLARAPALPDESLAPLLSLPDLRELPARAWDALAHADVAIVASGTATVEGALLQAPMVVVYRVAPLTYGIVRRLVKVPYAAMPNILLGEEVLPELLQDRCTPEAIAAAALRILRDPERARAIRARLSEVRALLGTGHPAERAAERVARHLTGTQS